MHKSRNRVLLVVEDSPEDLEMIRRSVRAAGIEAELRHCGDGDAALDFLERLPPYTTAPVPALVLLDLNLPGTDGRSVLEHMQGDTRLAAIPTVVFTNSDNINDVNACYALGANAYIRKPLGPAAFTDVMKRLRDHWFDLVIGPDISFFP